MKGIRMLARSTLASTDLAYWGYFHIRIKSNIATMWHWKSAAKYQDCGIHCKYYKKFCK
jgi:hypothetical protein